MSEYFLDSVCGNLSNAVIDTFLKYFKTQWCTEDNCGWFVGVSVGDPHQNNGLEGTNKWVKEEGTFRARLGVQQFCSVMEHPQKGIISIWSKDRNDSVDENGKPANINAKSFQTLPNVSLKDQTHAFQWNHRNKKAQRVRIEGRTFFFLPAGQNPSLSKKDCQDYMTSMKDLAYETFEELVAAANSIRIVEINEAEWKLSTCSCIWWSKNYICNHVIALSQRLRLMEFDDRASAIPVTQNRKRGRPAKTQSARVRQGNETQAADADDSSDSK